MRAHSYVITGDMLTLRALQEVAGPLMKTRRIHNATRS